MWGERHEVVQGGMPIGKVNVQIRDYRFGQMLAIQDLDVADD
jgi:hypothetical protein